MNIVEMNELSAKNDRLRRSRGISSNSCTEDGRNRLPSSAPSMSILTGMSSLAEMTAHLPMPS